MQTKNTIHCKRLLTFSSEQMRKFLSLNSCPKWNKTAFCQSKEISTRPQQYSSNIHRSTSLDGYGRYQPVLQLQRFPIFTSCRCKSSVKKEHEHQYYSKSHPKSMKRINLLKQKISSSENAEFFISHLSKTEQRFLLHALEPRTKTNEGMNDNGSEESNGVSKRQLRLVFLHNFVPFVGFGFLDNAIMILAGECIDLTIGVTLGISTMAAAALGNTISDIAGIGLAGSVEMLFLRIGLPVPALTPEQAEQRSTIISSNMGKAVGIVLGCLIGMFPLLLLEDKEEAQVNQP